MTKNSRMMVNENVSTNSLHQIRQIKRWLELCIPEPAVKNVHVQIGVHLEEIGEMLETLADTGISFEFRERLRFAQDVIEFVQRQFKAYEPDSRLVLEDIDRTELLDSLCDQIVTSVGIAHMLGMDIEQALQEVADSNDSKLGEDGLPIFDAQGKISKGPRYFKPDLEKFI